MEAHLGTDVAASPYGARTVRWLSTLLAPPRVIAPPFNEVVDISRMGESGVNPLPASERPSRRSATTSSGPLSSAGVATEQRWQSNRTSTGAVTKRAIGAVGSVHGACPRSDAHPSSGDSRGLLWTSVAGQHGQGVTSRITESHHLPMSAMAPAAQQQRELVSSGKGTNKAACNAVIGHQHFRASSMTAMITCGRSSSSQRPAGRSRSMLA
jgi:hypothetical protein